MEIGRGDLVIAVFVGDYGKPRPALVAHSDAFSELESITLLPLTSDLRDWPEFRITIGPTRENGLRERSHVMIDKATTVSRDKVRQHIGRLDLSTMRVVNAALTRFLGLDE